VVEARFEQPRCEAGGGEAWISYVLKLNKHLMLKAARRCRCNCAVVACGSCVFEKCKTVSKEHCKTDCTHTRLRNFLVSLSLGFARHPRARHKRHSEIERPPPAHGVPSKTHWCQPHSQSRTETLRGRKRRGGICWVSTLRSYGSGGETEDT
jgi:hypothetical protein